MNPELNDVLANLESKVNSSTDIGKAIEEFFRDHFTKPKIIEDDTHTVDIRSRLVPKASRGHSVITFLASTHVNEAKNSSLAEGLGVLSVSLKRHVISIEGKSRGELIELFKAQTESNKPLTNFNLLAPQKQ